MSFEILDKGFIFFRVLNKCTMPGVSARKMITFPVKGVFPGVMAQVPNRGKLYSISFCHHACDTKLYDSLP